MREILFAMRAGGCRIAVLTNKMEDVAQELCDTHFEFLQDMIVRGQKPGMPLKPDPAPVLAIMEEAGFDWDQTFYIGDSEVDVETARNSNIKCISCTWGFRTREQLVEAGAEHIIDSPLLLVTEMLNGGATPGSTTTILPQ
jgi:phosphoglycolate phosphatase